MSREAPPAKPGGAPVQAVDKMGRDGRWRSLSRGARTLSNLLAWEDRKAAGNRLQADADEGRRRLAQLEAQAERDGRAAGDVRRATAALIVRLAAVEVEQLLRRAMRPDELAADEAVHRPQPREGGGGRRTRVGPTPNDCSIYSAGSSPAL